MIRPGWAPLFGGFTVLALTSLLLGQRPAQPPPTEEELAVAHAECDFFRPERERFANQGLRRPSKGTGLRALSATTAQVARMIASVPGGSRTHTFDQNHPAGSIDSFIFADFKKNSIRPAERTTDWEFIRRVTLDLTGRIPTPDRVLAFVEDKSPDKRAKLIDELLAKPEWVDKWTMYFGDIFHNTPNRASTGLVRNVLGRNAFYRYIHDSLAASKPYNQLASEMITATTANTFEDGAGNFILNGYMAGGPRTNQDIMDLSAAAVFETFMGMAHVNCLMCHNGRGHVDTLSVWAGNVTRYQAWQLAAHFGKTVLRQVRYDSTNNNLYYWSVEDSSQLTDYPLNTTTGNRPPRVAPAGCKTGQPCYYVQPRYIMNDDAPQAGESYRASLARNITSDFQFARATVNYMWAYFFGRGLVDPPDSFDPARLDPNNPPPAPWTLQPSNAGLLNALAQHFVASGYDLKALMREITNSDTYQLSSRYNGQWNLEWEKYFARKFVRRLWGEEVHDAVAQSSGAIPSYNVPNFSDLGFGRISWAMQLPDTTGSGDGTTNALLSSFIPGNRDEQPRKYEGSILQALNLMNNAFIVNRTRATGNIRSELIAQNLDKNNTDLIHTLFLNILSRYPTPDELAKAQAAVPAAAGNSRTAAVQDLVWFRGGF